LKLSAEGTLEGDVQETLTGHRAEEARQTARNQSPAQREEALRDVLTHMFPDSEISSVSIENYDDAVKPIVLHYGLKAPLYAQATGKRLLFQPIPFQRAVASRFSGSDRKLPIEFRFAWKEVDEIHIALPDGYTLDNAESPGGLTFGDPGSYVLTIGVTKGEHPELVTNREFTFGNNGYLTFPVKSYASLKAVFDQIHLRDAHTLSLIQNAAAAKVTASN
jgi:hypothetical protein